MSRFLELLSAKNSDAEHNPPVTVAFLGDSVTNGCFEVIPTILEEDGKESFDVVFQPEEAYSMKLQKILHTFYPQAQINLVNAGISGDSAPFGLTRVERDVIRYQPDLTVVCYGLNDCCNGDEGIAKYHDALTGIIEKLKAAGSEVILMTPQPVCARVHGQLRGEGLRSFGKKLEGLMQDGGFDRYMQAARAAAEETDVPLCDCYARWMKLYKNGVDITDLLSNYLNHPTRDMHWLFAASLAETIFQM